MCVCVCVDVLTTWLPDGGVYIQLARAPLRCHPDGSPVRPSEFHLKVLCLHLLVETLDLTGDVRGASGVVAVAW